ncbi:MAG: hypothetical protein QGI68_15570 [Pseudomonadales bacterium]|jgi:hypothetical protein|nr:hypothetical protein [Pseudomonadales bacterium]MDP7596969.1 hypothetical protein [Pseudomonadales bacterium]HJN50851.1 hypothetical protein [Pseudomonadales bacterium]|tara:strand:+ start:2875 stop:3045 length:171 start_codon:yes stop_codon:yes gene_type:complete
MFAVSINIDPEKLKEAAKKSKAKKKGRGKAAKTNRAKSKDSGSCNSPDACLTPHPE